MLRKNTSGQFVHIAAVNATTGAALTGATISIRRSIDGTFAAGGATITEDTGLGFYKVALTQADTNGNNIAYFFTATNMIPICLNVVTTACDPTSTAFGLSLAKTTNITGFNDIAATAIVSSGAINTSSGAVSTVTTVTNQLTAAQIATGVWQDTTAGDFTAANSIGKSIMNGVSLGTGLTVNDLTTKTGFSLTAVTGLGNQTANITGNLSGSVGSVTAVSVGAITATSFAADAIDAAALAATAANEIRDAVWAKVLSEETGDPGATPAASSAIMLPYMGLRNKRETDSGGGTDKLYNSAGTVILTAAVSDTGTVFTKAKYA